MGLADLARGPRKMPANGDDDGAPPMALSIKAEPLDGKHAAAMLLKAFEAKDVAAIDDALRLHYAACQDEEGGDDDGDEYGGDGDDADRG